MKLLGSILAVLAAVFGVLYWQEVGTVRELKAKNATLAVAADKTAETAKISCADRAAALFKSLGYSNNEAPTFEFVGATYENHYNPSLKRCLMVLHTSGMLDGDIVTSHTLSDVDERLELGESGSVLKKAGQGAPFFDCHETLSGKPAASCKSNEEWATYVKSLMQ